MELIISVTSEVVSVWLVIEPCWKFGTTGTARTSAAEVKTTTTDVTVNVIIFPKWMLTKILHYLIRISLVNCPTALVPAPPAVMAIVPDWSIVPARSPATPAALVT